MNPPPGDIGFLECLADFFGLADAEKLAFMDEAALQRREIPADVADHAVLQRALPAFFRAARGHELTDKELASLAEDIKKLHTVSKICRRSPPSPRCPILRGGRSTIAGADTQPSRRPTISPGVCWFLKRDWRCCLTSSHPKLSSWSRTSCRAARSATSLQRKLHLGLA